MGEAYRTERDSMGEMVVPAEAYWGASTGRAVENFPISGLRMPRRFIWALGLVKWAAAEVNFRMGLFDARIKDLIQRAAAEVMEGKLDGEFVVDVFQTGSGTSTNMNANEVIASRANELATGKRGGKSPVHPNDHVNQQQSSNDVIPTAMQVAAAVGIRNELVPALSHLEQILNEKGGEFKDVVKIGRTHLQDATPVMLDQEVSGWCAGARQSVERGLRAVNALRELPLGGTAVGTGINSHPDFAKQAIEIIAGRSKITFVEAVNHFEAQGSREMVVEASGLLRAIAMSLGKIANDVRWLASGPRCGLGELTIPATQPGSSIMPGKVNPVMSEMVLQVCAQVVGNDATIAFADSPVGSVFELNMMMPVMAYNLLESVELLARAARVFADKCVAGMGVDRERCGSLVERSLAMCTALAPLIGYDRAAEIAKEAFRTGRTVREVARERGGLSEEVLRKALDPVRMTRPDAGNVGAGGGEGEFEVKS